MKYSLLENLINYSVTLYYQYNIKNREKCLWLNKNLFYFYYHKTEISEYHVTPFSSSFIITDVVS